MVRNETIGVFSQDGFSVSQVPVQAFLTPILTTSIRISIRARTGLPCAICIVSSREREDVGDYIAVPYSPHTWIISSFQSCTSRKDNAHCLVLKTAQCLSLVMVGSFGGPE